MPVAVEYDPADQARRRRRARISQNEIAKRLDIALSKVSEYENGHKPLPWKLTSEDYEKALAAALLAKKGDAA